jgi:hypothetical protein
VRSDVENLSRKPNRDYYETMKVASDEKAACKDVAALHIGCVLSLMMEMCVRQEQFR